MANWSAVQWAVGCTGGVGHAIALSSHQKYWVEDASDDQRNSSDPAIARQLPSLHEIALAPIATLEWLSADLLPLAQR